MFEAVDYLSRAYSTLVHSEQKEINVVSLVFILFFEEKSWNPRRFLFFEQRQREACKIWEKSTLNLTIFQI